MKHIYESTLLLVDDNRELREMVVGILHREGFSNIDTASCVREAEGYFRHREPDMIILDINLPDGDGFSLMQKIRTVSNVPVLFLSARDEDSDRLLGLGLGADDYMVKPFLPKELTLRISAILKRTYLSPNRESCQEEKLDLGPCSVDFKSGTVRWGQGRWRESAQGDGESKPEIPLTAKELLILRKLSENRGNIVTFDQLCQAVWEDNYFGYENTIMVHIRRLREKIEENPSKPKYLLTVRGLGYKLVKE
ncbi:MAG: response regulator transcription factor [Lachnospiraceae bacterium]|uniref:response regulator transcription factor n=1 Tax=Parablautia intestinalis TaxID=2320100 RepID=UPI0023CF787C|nr:response regulator transcription factor [Parablautia intestinalis]MDE7046559.1 response regulator transcription factor [Lachnospiraceae bacterium]